VINSGTEACMGMLRLVCAFTKREKVGREGGREGGSTQATVGSALQISEE